VTSLLSLENNAQHMRGCTQGKSRAEIGSSTSDIRFQVCSGAQASKRGAETEADGAEDHKKLKGPTGSANATGASAPTAEGDQEAEGDTRPTVPAAAANDEAGPSAPAQADVPTDLGAEANAADVDEDDGLVDEDNVVHNLVLAQFEKASLSAVKACKTGVYSKCPVKLAQRHMKLQTSLEYWNCIHVLGQA
jgi:hypothetical protein